MEQSCRTCLEMIATAALTKYIDLGRHTNTVLRSEDKDPSVELAVLASMALLKSSGLRQTLHPTTRVALSGINISRLLQAVAILHTQLKKLEILQLDTQRRNLEKLKVPQGVGRRQKTNNLKKEEIPVEIPVEIRLVLMQLYLLIGCASIAYRTWTPMGVKRAINEALAPHFFDRISTISPGCDARAIGEESSLALLRKTWSSLFENEAPSKIWEAFAHGNYPEIFRLAEYWYHISRSFTLVMVVVEERRATRTLGVKPNKGIKYDPLLGQSKHGMSSIRPFTDCKQGILTARHYTSAAPTLAHSPISRARTLRRCLSSSRSDRN